VALFLIIIGLSLVLALRSMRDYQEIPQKSKLEYGIFLIRKLQNFNGGILEALGKIIFEESLVVGIERLFKGRESALTIFGPKIILQQFANDLDLLELEDYTRNFDKNNFLVWEMGVKHNKVNLQSFNIFDSLPKLEPQEQLFWQMILGPNKSKHDLTFQTQIRAGIYAQDDRRRKELALSLQSLRPDDLVKIPKPFSNEQMIEFYRQRILERDSKGPVVGFRQVLSILGIN